MITLIFFCAFLFIFDSNIIYSYDYNTKNKPSQQIDSLQKELNLSYDKIINKQYILELDNIAALNKCNELLHFYRNNDPKTALLFANLIAPQVQKFKIHNEKATFFTKLGNIYHDIGKYHLAIDNYSKGLEIYKIIGEDTGICNNYNDIGYIFSKLKLREFALKNYFLGVNYVLKGKKKLKPIIVGRNKDIEEAISLGHAYSNIAYEYFDLNQIDSAIYYGKLSKKIFEKIRFIHRIAQLNNYLVEFNLGKKDYKTAKLLIDENLSILDTVLVEDTRYLGHTFRIKSRYMMEIGNYDEALHNIDKAIVILKQIELHREVDKCFNIKARILVIKGKIKEAIEVGINAYNVSKERDSFTENLNNTQLLAELYKLDNKLDSSIYFYIVNKSLNDSLFNIYKQDIINKFNVENELKNQELKLQLISKKSEISDIWLKILGAGILLIVVFFVVIYLQYKNKSKINYKLQKVLNEVETTNIKLQQSERNLLEINRTKDRFFSMIAHDLRGPISSFHTATGLLIDEFESLSNDEKLDFLIMIKDNAKRLSDLLNSLLNWAKSQQGQIIPNPTNVGVFELIEDTKKILYPLAVKKNIKIINQSDINHCIQVDNSMIGTTLNNIINNSIKFSYPYNSIIVRSFPVIQNNIELIAIEIEDFGVGIEPDVLKKVLSIEYNNSTPGTDNEEGSGLGLVLAKEFIEKNKGNIKIRSTVEIGTVVTITLPKCESK